MVFIKFYLENGDFDFLGGFFVNINFYGNIYFGYKYF